MGNWQTFAIGIVSGALAAFYGPYLSEIIKSRWEKKALRLAIYRELLYMYRLVSDVFDFIEKHYGGDAEADDDAKNSVVFFMKWYRTFLYDHDLYNFIRKDFNCLRLLYQLEDSFVIEKTYLDFYTAFHPDISPESPGTQYKYLSKYRDRFIENVRRGALSRPILIQASKTIHYGPEAIDKLFSQPQR